MPPRKRKCTPKLQDSLSALSGSLVVPKEAQRLIDDVEEQVLERVEGLLALAGGMQQSIRQEFTLKLMQLPKQVRDMPLKVFKEQYGADIKSVMLKDMEERLAASVAAGKLAATGLKTRTGANGLPATQRKTRFQAAMTPAVGLGSTDQAAPGTSMRAPAVNEIIYSARGSPLGFLQGQAGRQAVLQTNLKGGKVLRTPFIQPQQIGPGSMTVLPPQRPGSKTGVPDSMTFTLKDGQQVTVDFDGGLDEVPERQRDEVTELYHSHMDGLAKFASAFRKKCKARR